MKIILYIALFISIITYSFWGLFPKGWNVFYIGNALFVFLLSFYIFIQNKESFITFVMFGFCLNNLLDELFFDPLNLQLNELLIAVAIPLVWLANNKKYAIQDIIRTVQRFFL
jgi:hypothetical protein